MRYFIFLKFKGTAYHGWQIQPNAHTVQVEVQSALSLLMQQDTEVVAAGRTDAGVHAEEMVVHFDTQNHWDKRKFIHRMNSLLPKDIAVYDLREVKEDFHARFAALSRTYEYHIVLKRDPFQHELAYHYFGQLNVTKMNEAAQLLLGEKDFSCFSKSNTQTFTNNCDITEALWKQTGDDLVFTIKANRFLRNMVRAVVGTLLEIGENKRTLNSIPELIASKERSNAGTSAPADGLFLYKIDYPEEGFI